jgi:hypothetical protein
MAMFIEKIKSVCIDARPRAPARAPRPRRLFPSFMVSIYGLSIFPPYGCARSGYRQAALRLHRGKVKPLWSGRPELWLAFLNPTKRSAPLPTVRLRTGILLPYSAAACSLVSACASTTATAVMLTMPRAVVEEVTTWTGRAAPIRIGPTGSASASTRIDS